MAQNVFRNPIERKGYVSSSLTFFVQAVLRPIPRDLKLKIVKRYPEPHDPSLAVKPP